MTNSQKNEKDKKEFDNPSYGKILEILDSNITPEELKIMEEKKSFSENILDIISKEQTNRNLAIYLISEVNSNYFKQYKNFRGDKQIVKLAISKDSTFFYDILEGLKTDVSIGYTTIESMLREGRSFKEISEFIEKYYPKNKGKCFDHYNQLLLRADKFYTNDISKNIISLKANNPELFDKLLYLKIIDNSKNKISLNPDFIKNFVNTLFEDKSYTSKTQAEKQKIKEELLLDIFGKNLKELDEYEKCIFDSILKLIFVNEARYFAKNENTEDKKDNLEEKENIEKEEEIVIKEDFEDFGTFCYPECEIKTYSGGYYINTISGKSIYINALDAEEFTTEAFVNFMKFYNTFYDIGLSFIWDKYSLDFKTICNNRVGFNYLNGSGITEGKMLQVLNIIGKNIGVPEEEIENEKGEKTGKYKCFKNIGEAKKLFEEINTTGTIKGEKYSNNSAFGNTAVENKLINEDLIDTKKGILNINKWR